MKSAIAVAAALAAPALAQTVGNAVVINSCPYDVYLSNTPSAGGGYNAIDQTLSSGGSYSQQFTQLSNGNGWSMKLSTTPGAFEDNILQYEYTWQGWSGSMGGILWFDLSAVNGNPWDGDWEITGSGSCAPRQAAYRYSTDDAFGEQSCPVGSDITVQLCSGSGSSGAPPSSPSSPSAWAPTGAAPTQSAWSAPLSAGLPGVTNIPSPVTVPAAAPTSDSGNFNFQEGGNVVSSDMEVNNKVQQAPQPTTMATMASPAPNRGGVTVTQVQTTVVYNFVTATAEPTPAAKVAAKVADKVANKVANVKAHKHNHARHPHHRHS